MLISEKEEKDEDILQFISCHGMSEKGDYYNYHMSLGFYYAYSIDAFRYAEMIEDGEIFDEDEVSIVIRNLYVAYKTMKYFQSLLPVSVCKFDTAETVMMAESRLEKGRLVGKKENAVQTAKKWLQRFFKHNKYEKSSDRKGLISQDFFLYEVAVYILYLAGEEVDYGFLMQNG